MRWAEKMGQEKGLRKQCGRAQVLGCSSGFTKKEQKEQLLVVQYTLHYMGTVLEVRVKPKTIVMAEFIVRDTQGFNFSVHVYTKRETVVGANMQSEKKPVINYG